MQHILAFSCSAIIVRHWFEINLDNATMEHGARIEVRELAAHSRRGSDSAAQLVTADRPLWRADLFDRLADRPGSFAVAHFHPQFDGNEPSDRVWDPQLTASPWQWLGTEIACVGATAGRDGWPIDPADAAEISCMADEVVELARRFSPDRCTSASQCYSLTRDAQESVRLMIEYLRQPELLDAAWVAPWR